MGNEIIFNGQASSIPRNDLAYLANGVNTIRMVQNFINGDIAPVQEIQVMEGKQPTFRPQDLIADVDTDRADGAYYKRINLSYGENSFELTEKGLEAPLTERDVKRYGGIFPAETMIVRKLTLLILLKEELRMVDTLAALSGADTVTNVGSGNEFDNDIVNFRDQIIARVIDYERDHGQALDSIAMPKADFVKIVNAYDNKFNAGAGSQNSIGGAPMETQRNIIANYVGVDRISLGNAPRLVSKEGQAFMSGQAWTSERMYLYAQAEPDMDDMPGYARRLLWVPDTPEIATVDQYYDEKGRSMIYRVRQFSQVQTVQDDAIQVFTGYLQ